MAKKTRAANLADLGINWSYGDKETYEAELVASLAETHPRQFWSEAKHCLKDRRRDNEYLVLNAFSGRETLVRAGLSYAFKHQSSSGYGHNPALETMAAHAMALLGKSERYYDSVAARVAPIFNRLNASQIFETLLPPARTGNAYATLLLARLLPFDTSENPQEAKRHAHGRTGFAHLDIHDAAERASTIAKIHAQTHGIHPSKSARGTKSRARPPRLSGNAFFWVAHRHLAESAAGLATAELWAQAGSEIVRRCAKGITEGSETLALALGIKPFREALFAKLPSLSDARYFWRRDEGLFGAFQLCAHEEIKAIIDYAATGPAIALTNPDPLKPEAPLRYEGGLPAWALAILAGHPPDPAWMPEPGSLEATALFKIPKSSIDKAKEGALTIENIDRIGYSSTGASYEAAKLCKTLGHPWKAKVPKPVQNAKP